MAVGRFSDPVARRMLNAGEQADVDLARGPVPRGWAERMTYEFLTATAEILVSRTVAIDDMIRAAHARQVVILGAGLDGRAWRMRELAHTAVFEVDHPASQRAKQQRVAGLDATARTVAFVPVRLGRDRLPDALDAAGFDRNTPTAWVWEGVLPYLTAEAVHTTLDQIAACSAPGSQLAATYPTRRSINGVGRLALGMLFSLARRSSPMAGEPHVSAWNVPQMRSVLAGHGLTVTSDVDQLSLAADLGIQPRHRDHHRHSRVVTARVMTA